MQPFRFEVIVAVFTVSCFMMSYLSAAVAGIDTDNGMVETLATRYKVGHLTDVVKTEIEKTMQAPSANELELFTTAVDVEVKQIDGQEIKMHLQGEVPSNEPENHILTTEIVNKKVVIRVEDPANRESFGSFKFQFFDSSVFVRGRLLIEVPKSINEISLKSVSGEIILNGGDWKQVILRSVSGDTQVSGHIEQLEIKTVSGDVSANLPNRSPEVELSSTSGDINITLPEKPELQLSFNSISGSARVDKSLGVSIGDGNSLSAKLGRGLGQITVKTVSGDLNLTVE